MSDLKYVNCKSCGALMIFVTSPRGARLPVDATPLQADSIEAARYRILYTLDDAEPPNAHPFDLLTMPAGELKDQLVYVSHFATCPNAASHSKRAPKR